MLKRKLNNLSILYENHSDLLKDDTYFKNLEQILILKEKELTNTPLSSTFSSYKLGISKYLLIYTDKGLKPSIILLFYNAKTLEISTEASSLDININKISQSVFKQKCDALGTPNMKRLETLKLLNDIKELLLKDTSHQKDYQYQEIR